MATKATNQRNWTIMVYLAGDNNLDSAGLVDLKEMKTTGTTDKIAVLAQFDRAGAKRSTVRYCLKKGTTLAKDACLMSMAEVAFQMRDVADYSVGSEETEPGDGWPYDRILKALVGKPEMTPEELSESIVNSYLASYKAGDNVTQSAVKLAALKHLTTAVDGLAQALKNILPDAPSRSALISARSQVQEYSRPYDDYCDLLDLCDLLDRGISAPTVQTACAAVRKAAAEAIVATGYKGTAVDNSQGISLYFPKRKLSPLYKTLDFTKKSSWDEFLTAYLAGLGR